MKKFFSAAALMTTSLFFVLIACAQQSPKVITLKDGSVLQGHVILLENGIYTIETTNLGRMTVPEENILQIAAPGAPSSLPTEAAQGGTEQNSLMKQQVQQVQGAIMADPQLMQQLQELTSDPQVQQLLSDPQLLKDVMSYDPQAIQNNENIQTLQNNPKIQEMIQKIDSRINQQE